MNAQTRRRERRVEKQTDWKVDNPLLVGICAKPETRMRLNVVRKAKSRVDKALSVRSTQSFDSLDNCCLPQTAIFVTYRRKNKALTAKE